MYNISLIGFGGMGNFHCENIATLDGFKIRGVYDINPKKLELAREKGFETFETLEELLNDNQTVTVIIATPNNFHKELSIACLKAGKNVICEKPVMMNADELKEVIKVSEQTGKQFTVHQNRRWDEDFNIVKKAINDDLIGKPFYIESRVQGAKGVPGDWRCVKSSGGGMLLDWGVHLIDQIMWLVDSPVVEVYSHMLSVKFDDVDDNFKALIKFENGLSALVEVDTYTFIPLPRWHVSGDKGTLQIDSFKCDGKIVRAKESIMNFEEGIVYTASGPTKTMAPRPKETIEEIELPKVSTKATDYYINFKNAHEGTAELIVKPSQALRVMQVIDALFLSAQENRAVSLHI